MNMSICSVKRDTDAKYFSSYVELVLVFLFFSFTCLNMYIAMLETIAHDALPFMDSYVGKFTSEGRWINFALFGVLREIPQGIAFPLCNVFVFIFGYQVVRPLLNDKWLAVCFALTFVNIPYFTMLFKWPMTLLVGMGLLALLSCVKDRFSMPVMLLGAGILLFASYPAFYFLMPLLYVHRLSKDSFAYFVKFFGVWIAGYLLGYVVAQLAVYLYTFVTEGHGHLIEFAGWRKSTPATNFVSLLDNIQKSAGDFTRNANYLAMLSPLFFVPVALVAIYFLKSQFKYLLAISLVVFSIYASVVVLGVKVPLRSGITLPIGMVMIGLLIHSRWSKMLLLLTLFIPYTYATYIYNDGYHEKRVLLRSVIEPADTNGYFQQPDRFKQVVVKVDEVKTSQYFYHLTGSDAFKHLSNLREHYIKPYFYTHGWKADNIKVIDTSVIKVTGRAKVDVKGDTLYLVMD